jgi:phenylalanyl-tRNA synthetase beta chain
MGRVFRNAGGGKARDQESENLAILLSGGTAPVGMEPSRPPADLYDLKGLINALVPNKTIRFSPRERDGFALGCDIKADDQNIGVFARLMPARERELDFTSPVSSPSSIYQNSASCSPASTTSRTSPNSPAPPATPRWKWPPPCPTRRSKTSFSNSPSRCSSAFECFDVFTDPTGAETPRRPQVPRLPLPLPRPDRTLKAEEVDTAHQKVLEALE